MAYTLRELSQNGGNRLTQPIYPRTRLNNLLQVSPSVCLVLALVLHALPTGAATLGSTSDVFQPDASGSRGADVANQ